MNKPSAIEDVCQPDTGEFEPERLQTFLKTAIPGLIGQMSLQRIGGGQSNPSYFVDFANRAFVLRKQPAGNLLPSAHAIDREYRIMNALADSGVPVPRTVLFYPDRDVVGTPFYLMEKLEGRVFADYALSGVTAADRREMYQSMAKTMARLHQLDWAAVGLSDFGKPGHYFKRQISRWTKQWEMSKTRENRNLDRLVAWLPENIPDSDVTTISHGDLRMGNLMFHPTEPRIIAVLDWELSTLGHPLADVAYNCLAWHTSPEEYGGMLGMDLKSLGIPSNAEYLTMYSAAGGRIDGLSVFHYAFALFRFAVILEGISARAEAGIANAANAKEVGKLGLSFARRAVEMIDAGLCLRGSND